MIVYPEPEAYLFDHSCDHPADLSDQQVRGWTRRPGWGQRQESVRGHVQPFAVHHSCGLRGAPIRAQAIPAQQINLRSNGQQHGGRYRCLYRHAGIAKCQHTTRKDILTNFPWNLVFSLNLRTGKTDTVAILLNKSSNFEVSNSRGCY